MSTFLSSSNDMVGVLIRICVDAGPQRGRSRWLKEESGEVGSTILVYTNKQLISRVVLVSGGDPLLGVGRGPWLRISPFLAPTSG